MVNNHICNQPTVPYKYEWVWLSMLHNCILIMVYNVAQFLLDKSSKYFVNISNKIRFPQISFGSNYSTVHTARRDCIRSSEPVQSVASQRTASPGSAKLLALSIHSKPTHQHSCLLQTYTATLNKRSLPLPLALTSPLYSSCRRHGHSRPCPHGFPCYLFHTSS